MESVGCPESGLPRTSQANAARPAATVMLLRDGPSGLEVFMVVRHHEIDFASGALVFPGGRLDAADFELAADPVLRALGPDGDTTATAFRVAAIRETYEECGILLARARGRVETITPERLAALDAGRPFAELLRCEDLVPALDLLVPFAHWITPEVAPKRFDTHFFVTAVPSDQAGKHDGREAVDSTWISPQQALQDAKSGRYTLVFATERNLWKLSQFASVAVALDAARASRIVTVMPELVGSESGRVLKVPAAAGYGGEAFPIER